MMLVALTKSEDNPSEPETFVLTHPDFDSQNIMIDEQGNLTGLIDWDNAQIMPRFLGYCSYPEFLMCDWHPMYDWCPCQPKDSPEELVRYRQIYSDKMIQMLGGEGDAIFAAKSHIFAAVEQACFDDGFRTDRMMKVVQEILPEKDPLQVLFSLGRSSLESYRQRYVNMEPEVFQRLCKGITELLSV